MAITMNDDARKGSGLFRMLALAGAVAAMTALAACEEEAEVETPAGEVEVEEDGEVDAETN